MDTKWETFCQCLCYCFLFLVMVRLLLGLVFLVTTTLVFIFKHEIDHSIVSQPHEKAENGHHNPMDDDSDSNNNDEELSLGVFETYAVLVKILCLKPMRIMVIALLTGKIAFAATDGMTDLKLINDGADHTDKNMRPAPSSSLRYKSCLSWVLGKQIRPEAEAVETWFFVGVPVPTGVMSFGTVQLRRLLDTVIFVSTKRVHLQSFPTKTPPRKIHSTT
ncbi:hypothetical protein niasHT_025727 [Heterodera trifolii]|uniref:Uncharacterized protein n=1 Tax=Heterodera trifolii TaxID=157864 RepID=A0ABD2K8F3_9BILA